MTYRAAGLGRRRARGRRMDRQVPSLKAALGRLYVDLQAKQVGGAVPYQVFRDETEKLGLSQEERARLATALTGMNLRISEPPRPVSPPAPAREQASSSRLDTARRLLGRYADGQGQASARAVEGVARLAGLSAQEAAELQAGGPATRPSGGPALSRPTREMPAVAPAATVPLAPGNLRAAVDAARAVLTDDQFTRRPAKRILTAAEEIGLSVLLRGGTKQADREPTDAELAELRPTDERRRARDCLITHNQGLVHSMARQFPDQGLDYEDVVQHGMLGLLRAARKFDPLMGYKFSTYATQWVRQMISRGVADEGSIIRIPVHMHELMQKVARTERTRLSSGLSVRAADVAVACDLSIAKVEQIRRLSRRTDSLDRIVGDGVHLGDLIEARTAIPSVEHTVIDALSNGEMREAVAALPERYAHIMTRRYGLDGQDPATLDEIGKDFEVTRERVRQLELRLKPLLQIAFADPTGDPYRTLRTMLTDRRLDAAGSNPVHAISKDLAAKDWSAGLGALQAFRRREGACLPPPDHVEATVRLGEWIEQQRRVGGIDGAELLTHRRVLLESLGLCWEHGPQAARPSPRRRSLRRVIHPQPVTPPSLPTVIPSPRPPGPAPAVGAVVTARAVVDTQLSLW
ncbi:sigma-70 family RNA polymerase sigma factor [Kitasatospora sp. Root107]|nr:sigma-70 family RNA polymerase sigma factor [Kitasatospora sp. Root107]